MSIALKIILLILGVLAFVGCVLWWTKEDGWEPKVATITSLSTLIVLTFNLSQNKPDLPPPVVTEGQVFEDTTQNVSTTGNNSPAVISNGGGVEINYNKPIDSDTINN